MPVFATIIRKTKSLSQFSVWQVLLIMPVFVLLGIARLAIGCAPFRLYTSHMGKQVELKTKSTSVSDAKMIVARKIGQVVASTAKITPWQSLCLAQAMVASLLLRSSRIPYQVVFGLAAENRNNRPDPLAAHAWLRVANTNITGGKNVQDFTVVTVLEHTLRTHT